MRKAKVRGAVVLAAVVMIAGLLSQCGPRATPGPKVLPETTIRAPEVEPPPAVLEVDGQEQVSGIGSYCWSDPEGGVSLCADMVGLITPEKPLAAPAAFTARFYLGPEEKPGELALRTIPVSAEDDDELSPSGEGWRAWRGAPGTLYPVPLERTPEIALELERGMYVLELFARWEEWGDASYGFLLEVGE